MSSGNEGDDGTIISTGPNIIQLEDFYKKASLLHPLVIGSIAVITLFLYLRLSSNRTVAPITVFDWIINVALGSTLAGIVNGNSLARGVLGLVTILSFQYFTSYTSSHYHHAIAWFFSSPPLIVAFRGRQLSDVMKSHRISREDLMGALRQKGVLHMSQVECVIIEPTGMFSIFLVEDLRQQNVHPEVLFDIKAYKQLYEDAEAEEDEGATDWRGMEVGGMSGKNGDEQGKRANPGSTKVDGKSSNATAHENRVAEEAC